MYGTDRPGRTMTAATAHTLLHPKDGGRACNATLWSSRYNCTTAKLHYRSRESRDKFGRLGLFPAGVSPRFCRFVGHKRAYRVPVFSRALASSWWRLRLESILISMRLFRIDLRGRKTLSRHLALNYWSYSQTSTQDVRRDVQIIVLTLAPFHESSREKLSVLFKED